MRRVLAACLFALAAHGPALAQGDVGYRLKLATAEAAALQFPDRAMPIADAQAPQMALYKPDGDGPFPAVVVHHQCGGLRSARGWQNASVLQWAREAVARGYVALVVDSLGPRNVASVCAGAQGGVNFPRGVRDAFEAAAHLRRLPFVDGQRVMHLGFSWGAMVGTLASGKEWGEALASGTRFRAVASLYPGCFTFGPSGGQFQVLSTDVDTPLLFLGGGADNETPAGDCVSRLEKLKASGARVEWHVYPAATHCWDCSSLDGFRKTVRGQEVQYKFDPVTTRDSIDRVFAFFAEGKK
jgi:dienelactone hydrolase